MSGAGDLGRRITIQRATVTFDDFGSEVETWGDLATVWAGKRDASAMESYRAQEVGAQISARFLIRYSSLLADVNPRDRLIFDGRQYNITRVTEPEGTRNRWRWIEAVARADDVAVVVP